MQPAARLAPQLVGAATRLVLEAARLHEGEPPAPAAGAHAQLHALRRGQPASLLLCLAPLARHLGRDRPAAQEACERRRAQPPPRGAHARLVAARGGAQPLEPAAHRVAAAQPLRAHGDHGELAGQAGTPSPQPPPPAAEHAGLQRALCVPHRTLVPPACLLHLRAARGGGRWEWLAGPSVGRGCREETGLRSIGVHATARSGVRTEEMEFDATLAS